MQIEPISLYYKSWNFSGIKTKLDDDLRAEYDFNKLKGGIRGKYAKQYHAGTNLVLLDADVAKVFPNDEALRQLIKIAKDHVEQTRGQGLKGSRQ